MNSICYLYFTFIIAGLACLLYLLHHQICSNGSSGILDVCSKCGITNNFKPSNWEAELKSSHLHYYHQSHIKICINGYTNCECYWKLASILPQWKSICPSNKNRLGIQHYHCGSDSPIFGSLMSLMGAFLSVTTSILLPGLCYLKISGIYQNSGIELVVIIGVVVMGISAVIMGTYTSIAEIINQL